MKIQFDATNVNNKITQIDGFGDEHIKVTNKCLLKDGEPWLPAMGEMQYSKVAEKEWENSLKLMKDGGISIVSSYVFWNHHEEEKGNFRFDGNLNIRKFIQLCKKHGLYFFLRIGPLVHGESRYGGFPDWLVEECREACKDMDIKWSWAGIGTRRMVEPYMTYARKYMNTVLDEVKDLDNIIGIQIENEVSGPYQDYMRWLKDIAVDSGIKVPIYTATGWNDAKLDDTGLLPVSGGYADFPWDKSMNDITNAISFHFRPLDMKNEEIGSDLLESGNDYIPDSDQIWYMTAELGTGVQVSYHRRPIITPLDTYALAMCALGSGVNVLGFYVYRGGHNPIGNNSFMQESKETNYPNDYPCISYDFQAAIGEAGQIREQYFMLKEIFDFCKDFGSVLAPMTPVLPENCRIDITNQENATIPEGAVRCAIRCDGEKGFLFVNNHNHMQKLDDASDAVFEIKLKDKMIEIPFALIPADSCFCIPFGFTFGKLKTRYITAKLKADKDNTLKLVRIPGIEPVICMENGELVRVYDGMIIDGTKILISESPAYEISKGNMLKAEMSSDNTKSFECFRHLNISDKTKEYRVYLEEDTKYVKIDWMGNVAASYTEDRLMCDSYYTGMPWVIDVSKVKGYITIKIQPFTQEELGRIYLNKPAEAGVTDIKAEGFTEEYIYI